MKNNRQGYALIIVLWSLVIIGIIFVNLMDEIQLNNLLVQNNLQQKRLSTAAVDGVNKAIALLVNDKTEYDAGTDQWTKKTTLQVNEDITVKVLIEDIGSKKLNINYASYDLLGGLDWWTSKLETKLRSHSLIPRLGVVKSLFGDKYQKAKASLTTYGCFNLNTSRISSLRKLMKLKQISKAEQERIIRKLKQRRHKSGNIDSVDDLPQLAGGIAFEKLKPQLTVSGSFNINLVGQDILKMIVAAEVHEGLSKSRREKTVEERVKKIINYRQQEAIESYQQLYRQRLIPRPHLEKMEPYFNVYSSYLVIKAVASRREKEDKYQIKVVVNRTRQDNQWQVKIIDWFEN